VVWSSAPESWIGLSEACRDVTRCVVSDRSFDAVEHIEFRLGTPEPVLIPNAQLQP